MIHKNNILFFFILSRSSEECIKAPRSISGAVCELSCAIVLSGKSKLQNITASIKKNNMLFLCII